ncbi:MAG: 6-phosphogluconolactonase, partial [Caldilinea sp.]
MEKKLLVRVTPTADDLAHVACEIIAAAATASIGRRRFFRIALAGGSTPRAVYRLLADDPYMDFRRWQIFWSDERCVPPTSPESNYRMAKETLLDRLAEPPALVFRMAGEGDPDAAALAYERAVRELVPPNPAAGTGETPRFDL